MKSNLVFKVLALVLACAFLGLPGARAAEAGSADRLRELRQKQRDGQTLTPEEEADLKAATDARRGGRGGGGGGGEKKKSGRQEPTHKDVKYGDHDRHLLDFWQAKSDKPTPVLVSIHGGGFSFGNRSVDGGLLQKCLASGSSVAAIT